MNIWFATNNSHKKNELNSILNIDLKIPCEEGLSFNPEETGMSFIDNALIKARELQKLTGSNEPVIADDSGLCVDALDGRPGVLSARYGFEKENKLTSTLQNIMLLEELGNSPKRSARFVCAMVLFFNNDRFFIVQETLEGEIVKDGGLKGEGGFGYDPVFLIPSLGRTLAELSEEEKNSLSHRGKAGKHIAGLLKNLVF
jgi:XTP/dITP diphosphohydrolase